MLTLRNVCAVHQGLCSKLEGFGTLGDIIEYTGGVQYAGGYHEYTGGVQYSRDTMSTAGDTMMSVEDIMSTPGVFSTLGDTTMSVGDIMSTPGMFTTLEFPYKFNYFPNNLPPLLS